VTDTLENLLAKERVAAKNYRLSNAQYETATTNLNVARYELQKAEKRTEKWLYDKRTAARAKL